MDKPIDSTSSKSVSSEDQLPDGFSNEPASQETPLTIQDKASNAANQWLARNRNLVLRQTPVWAQTMVGLLVGLGSVAVLGGIVFRIDEVVSVTGQLKSIGGTVEVKTPAGGRVANVFIEDGEVVTSGQLLMSFDTREAMDEKKTLDRLIEIEEKELKNRIDTVNSQKQTLKGRLEVIDKKLVTKKYIIDELEKLVVQGGFQKLQLLEQQDQLFELLKQRSELVEQIAQLDLQGGQYRFSATKNIDQMKNRLNKAIVQLQYQNVLAPTSGIIFDSQARKDGVLGAGERILSIVPQDGLYAEVFVPNKDIGFVKPGQAAKVRVDAFPFSRYGELDGTVSRIGADALPPSSAMNFYRFSVQLNLSQNHLESRGVKIPLQSGMAVTTNLKLREKRVISLVSDLLVDQTDSIRTIRQ